MKFLQARTNFHRLWRRASGFWHRLQTARKWRCMGHCRGGILLFFHQWKLSSLKLITYWNFRKILI